MNDKLPVILRAAWLYYQDGFTQAEIAKQLAVSRATIGRFLEAARETGIVTFHFHGDSLGALSLSQEMRTTFGLRDAVVIPGTSEASEQGQVNDRIAKGAAQFLASRMPSGTMLAIGWGDTVSRTLGALSLIYTGRLGLVTMTGGANVYVDTIIERNIFERSGGSRIQANVVPAPIIASSRENAAAITGEQEVRQVLDQSHSAQFALVGVGTPRIDSTLMKVGYVSSTELGEIAAAGAVGDVLGQFFGSDGKVLELPIHERRIGLDIQGLRGRENVIAVAGGGAKVHAILAALYGGFCDTLVTDEMTAQLILQSHRSEPAQ
jgi:lsr operon transcriptional repressor